MIPIRDYLKDHIVIMDGAFGTYYAQQYGMGMRVCEWANHDAPEKVRSIHQAYVESGAKLLRSNTFLVNAFEMGMDEESSKELLQKGYQIAKAVADDNDCYAAADIGPVTKEGRHAQEVSIPEILNEYKRIIDIFLEEGADIFVFETMAEVEPLKEAVTYLKGKAPQAFVLCQFAVRPDGYTRVGIGLSRLMAAMKEIPCDAYGFNCASGPAHMVRHIKKARKVWDRPMSVLPNAGFPKLMEGRTTYEANESYFAELMMEMVALGVKLPGGCCGTTPGHIKALAEAIKKEATPTERTRNRKSKSVTPSTPMPDHDIFVELTPPHHGSYKAMLDRVQQLKGMGVKKITLPDSPLGRARMNPLMLSGMIRGQVAIDTLAHLCCRDRNITALQSDIMAAWAGGLRRVLCITGDPVAAGSRDDIKSVFNLTAVSLMKLICHMNEELFAEEPIQVYGAVNLSARNFDVEIKRSERKAKAGAVGLLSQAIYTDEAVDNIRRLKEAVDIKVYAGIFPPVSYRNAMFLKNEVPGITVPDAMVEALAPIKDREEAEQMGVDLTAKIAKSALQYADGLYIMLPFGRVSVANKLFHTLRGENDDTQ